MKKLFYVLLISIFCMGIVSCANTYTKIIKSKAINTVFDEISEASGSTLVDSTVEESSIKDSTITKSKILANSKILTNGRWHYSNNFIFGFNIVPGAYFHERNKNECHRFFAYEKRR